MPGQTVLDLGCGVGDPADDRGSVREAMVDEALAHAKGSRRGAAWLLQISRQLPASTSSSTSSASLRVAAERAASSSKSAAGGLALS